jgi:Sec-independent protein secretion pathway component TatC
MKICFMGALVVTIPILIYNLIMFVRPIFEEIVPLRRVYVTTAASSGLAIAGAAFGFIFIVPGSLHFFAGFQVSGLSALISADSYLNFVTNVIITFVLVFQLPLLVAFVDSIKPLPPKRMLGLEKWVVLASLIIALLVPFAFDFMTCLMIALPIVVLYNLSIVIVMAQHASFNRRVRAKARANQIVRPQQFTAAEASELTLSQLSFESLGDELTQLDRNEPLRAASPQRAGIDIRPLSTRPETVVSAAWVHHLADPIKLSAQARLISDVRRPSSIAL